MSLEDRPRLSDVIIGLTRKHGSPEERRLLLDHQAELTTFLDHPDTHVQSPRAHLDIGLENKLSLKLMLVASRKSAPWGLIATIGKLAPELKDFSEIVIYRKIRCNVGLSLSPAGIEYELFAYETPGNAIARLFAPQQPDRAGLPTTPYCFGYTSGGRLNAYAESTDIPAELFSAEKRLLQETGSLGNTTRVKSWYRSCRTPTDGWRMDLSCLEILPFPSHTLTAIAPQLNLHFSFLLYRGGQRPYGVLGISESRNMLHTPFAPSRMPPSAAPDVSHAQ